MCTVDLARSLLGLCYEKAQADAVGGLRTVALLSFLVPPFPWPYVKQVQCGQYDYLLSTLLIPLNVK
jgi:hypothetical protein